MPGLRLRAPEGLPLASLSSLAAGLALSLAFPPARLWPLAFIAIAPLIWLLDRSGPAKGALLGLAYGIGCYGATIYWIWRFGELAWVALSIVMAISLALFGAAYASIRRPGRPVISAFAAASLWTLIDWIRGMWPLGGFTWGSVGISQVDNRVTVRLATIAGVWGVTFVVVAANGLVVAGFRARGTRFGLVPWSLAAALALGPGVLPFGGGPGPESGPTVDIATVQVDVRQAAQASRAGEDVRVAGLNIAAHEQLATGTRPDLIVWGEGALDPAAAADPTVMDRVRRAIASVGVPTLVGAVTEDAEGGQRTDVVLFDGNGNPIGHYDKVHLVPFGEYVPFRGRLSWIDAIDQVPVDRIPGESIHTLEADGVPAFGTPICFENSFAALPRAFVRDGASFLIVTVNNASYGFTAASEQHQQMSQMRAIETGRWVVNAAVSGISAFIDPSGRVVESAGLFEPAILRHTIASTNDRTGYVRLGDWVPWLCLVVVAFLFALPRRRRRTRESPGPLGPGFRSLVILPTYDEAATIDRVLEGVLAAPQRVDVVVVDDSSPDGTAEIVRARAASEPRVRLIQRPAKSGLASAYQEGFRIGLAEEYDLVVEMDSDLSHDPAELPALLEAAAAGRDLAVGSRYVPGGEVTNWSAGRVALSRAGNRYARFMLGLPVNDATSGYRVYRRELLTELVRSPIHSEGYGFQIELVMRTWNLGFDLGETPITFRERAHGQSKISRGIVVEALWLVTIWGLKARLRGSGR
ncbi:MAG: apolipoprotein N-acyltransferase [Actinomycetota bacterium]